MPHLTSSGKWPVWPLGPGSVTSFPSTLRALPGLVPWLPWPCAPAQLWTALEAFSPLWASYLGLFKSLRRKALWSRGHLPFQPTWLPPSAAQTAWGYGGFLPPKAGPAQRALRHKLMWTASLHLFPPWPAYICEQNSLCGVGFFYSSVLHIQSCISSRYIT